ncbi:bifunctional DNA primase/polymerase [Kitasatospora sp. NPDC004240]
MAGSSELSPHQTDPHAIAQWCAAQGWPVHPLTPGSKQPARKCAPCQARGHTAENCPCLSAGRWCHSFLAATTDPKLITAWWTADPRFGVGVSCGPAGLVVIDVDVHPSPVPSRERILPGVPIHEDVDLTGLGNGFDTLALLAALRGEPNPADDIATLRVRTPSGGLHIWYQALPHLPFRCSTSKGTGKGLAWQVDIRAQGGYIIAPGTTTDVGTYTALGTTRRPTPLPVWLAQELLRTDHAPEPGTAYRAPLPPPRARQAVLAAGGGTPGTPRTLTALLAEVAVCAAAAEGMGFTDKLNRAAFTAGGLVAAGYLTERDAQNLLYDVSASARPHQQRRNESIIRSGLAAGARRPFHPRGRA